MQGITELSQTAFALVRSGGWDIEQFTHRAEDIKNFSMGDGYNSRN